MYARQGTLQRLAEQQTLAFLASEGYTKTDKTKNNLQESTQMVKALL